jgi:hypothetical protein
MITGWPHTLPLGRSQKRATATDDYAPPTPSTLATILRSTCVLQQWFVS